LQLFFSGDFLRAHKNLKAKKTTLNPKVKQKREVNYQLVIRFEAYNEKMNQQEGQV
jgi:hypothetical protein